MEIVFVDLEWSREVKHNLDTDLSEPYRRNVNNRELNLFGFLHSHYYARGMAVRFS